MTLTLILSPELEKRLVKEAKRRGIAPDQYAAQLLAESIPLEDRRVEAVSLLQSWIDEEDDEEQRQTGEYLVRVLEQDRLSDRKLFPPELKDVSW